MKRIKNKILILLSLFVATVSSRAQPINWQEVFPPVEVNTLSASLTDFHKGMESDFLLKINDSLQTFRPDSALFLHPSLAHSFMNEFSNQSYYGSKTSLSLQPVLRFSYGEHWSFYLAFVRVISYELGYSESISLSIFPVFETEGIIGENIPQKEFELAAYSSSYVSDISGVRNMSFTESVIIDMDSNGELELLSFMNRKSSSRNIPILGEITGWHIQNEPACYRFGYGQIIDVEHEWISYVNHQSPLKVSAIRIRQCLLNKEEVHVSLVLVNSSNSVFSFRSSSYNHFNLALSGPEQYEELAFAYVFGPLQLEPEKPFDQMQIEPGESLKIKCKNLKRTAFSSPDHENEIRDYRLIINVFQEGSPNQMLGIAGRASSFLYISRPVLARIRE